MQSCATATTTASHPIAAARLRAIAHGGQIDLLQRDRANLWPAAARPASHCATSDCIAYAISAGQSACSRSTIRTSPTTSRRCARSACATTCRRSERASSGGTTISSAVQTASRGRASRDPHRRGWVREDAACHRGGVRATRGISRTGCSSSTSRRCPTARSSPATVAAAVGLPPAWRSERARVVRRASSSTSSQRGGSARDRQLRAPDRRVRAAASTRSSSAVRGCRSSRRVARRSNSRANRPTRSRRWAIPEDEFVRGLGRRAAVSLTARCRVRPDFEMSSANDVRRRRDLPAAGRHPVGHRARRGADPPSVARQIVERLDDRFQLLDGRTTPDAAPADAPCRSRLEPRSARRRMNAYRAPHAWRSSLAASPIDAAEAVCDDPPRVRPPAVAGPKVARRDRGRRSRASLPIARDRARLRRGEARRGGRRLRSSETAIATTSSRGSKSIPPEMTYLDPDGSIRQERHNLRAALRLVGGAGTADLVGRLASTMNRIWIADIREGRRWLTAGMEAVDELDPEHRVRLLAVAAHVAVLAMQAQDGDLARRAVEASEERPGVWSSLAYSLLCLNTGIRGFWSKRPPRRRRRSSSSAEGSRAGSGAREPWAGVVLARSGASAPRRLRRSDRRAGEGLRSRPFPVVTCRRSRSRCSPECCTSPAVTTKRSPLPTEVVERATLVAQEWVVGVGVVLLAALRPRVGAAGPSCGGDHVHARDPRGERRLLGLPES